MSKFNNNNNNNNNNNSNRNIFFFLNFFSLSYITYNTKLKKEYIYIFVLIAEKYRMKIS